VKGQDLRFERKRMRKIDTLFIKNAIYDINEVDCVVPVKRQPSWHPQPVSSPWRSRSAPPP